MNKARISKREISNSQGTQSYMRSLTRRDVESKRREDTKRKKDLESRLLDPSLTNKKKRAHLQKELDKLNRSLAAEKNSGRPAKKKPKSPRTGQANGKGKRAVKPKSPRARPSKSPGARPSSASNASEFFAPMKLYSVSDLLSVAMTKYEGSSGFLSAALAAKRKGVQALTLKALPASEQSAPSDCPLYELPGIVAEEAVGLMREKYHFLLTFTTYAIVRDESLAMKLWLDRFPDVDAARAFQYLPASMKESMKFMNDGKPITSSGSELPPWPMDSTQLKQQDALARQRASEFIRRGIPNRDECNLLKTILDDIPAELEQFPFLFLYEWNPSTSIGQGDAVFANDRGGLKSHQESCIFIIINHHIISNRLLFAKDDAQIAGEEVASSDVRKR